jgi:hypothetical protein
MIKQIKQYSKEDAFFISAVQQEIFNRILPTIRHDLVGYLSAGLMRTTIIKKLLDNEDVSIERLKLEALKIEGILKDNVTSVRELSFWDFATSNKDSVSNVLKKSVQLSSNFLIKKNIKLNLHDSQHHHADEVESKVFLYSTLILFCYFEDNGFDNHVIDIAHSPNSITLTFEPNARTNATSVSIERFITIDKEVLIKFTKLHHIYIEFNDQLINVKW